MPKIRALVSIGGTDLPEPSTYSGNTATLVESGRNVQGKFIGAIVREDVAKVEIGWRYLTVKDWAKVCSLFTSSFINSVSFFNQVTGDWTTRQMYVSDRNAGAWRRDPKTGEMLGWTDCKLSLVEV